MSYLVGVLLLFSRQTFPPRRPVRASFVAQPEKGTKLALAYDSATLGVDRQPCLYTHTSSGQAELCGHGEIALHNHT